VLDRIQRDQEARTKVNVGDSGGYLVWTGRTMRDVLKAETPRRGTDGPKQIMQIATRRQMQTMTTMAAINGPVPDTPVEVDGVPVPPPGGVDSPLCIAEVEPPGPDEGPPDGPDPV